MLETALKLVLKVKLTEKKVITDFELICANIIILVK